MCVHRYSRRQRYAVVHIKGKRLSGFFASHKRYFKYCLRMADRPRLLPLAKEATPTSLGQLLRLEVSDHNGCCWPRFQTPSSCHYGSLEPAVSSHRPIWHRGFVSRGGSAIRHSITKTLPAGAGVPGDLAQAGRIFVFECRKADPPRLTKPRCQMG